MTVARLVVAASQPPQSPPARTHGKAPRSERASLGWGTSEATSDNRDRLLTAALLAGPSSAAMIKAEGLVLHAEGGFEPQVLPRKAFAPISFQGYFDIAASDGGEPAALQEAVLEFDRNGRLDTTGLATCAPAQIAEKQLRRRAATVKRRS